MTYVSRYRQITGEGLCADANGREGTARPVSKPFQLISSSMSSPVSQFQINFQENCSWGKLGRHKSPLWPRSFLQSICFQCWRECGRDALRHQRSKIFLLGVVHQGLVWKGLPSNPLDWQPCDDCTNHWAPHVFLPCQGDLSCSSWQNPWLHDEICGEKR